MKKGVWVNQPLPNLGNYPGSTPPNIHTAEMYATLLVIILIGVIVQYGLLEPIEKHTAGKWGMKR